MMKLRIHREKSPRPPERLIQPVLSRKQLKNDQEHSVLSGFWRAFKTGPHVQYGGDTRPKGSGHVGWHNAGSSVIDGGMCKMGTAQRVDVSTQHGLADVTIR
jgi:hypothetical protein